jgi:hypothetical protein
VQSRHLLLAAVAVLVGCGRDNPAGPSGGASGTVTFAYTGGGGGTFNVSGVMPTLQAQAGASNWAAGHRDTPNTQTEVFGARTRGGGRYDAAFVGINRLTVGSSQVQADCDPETDNCSGMVLVVNISEADDNFDFVCLLATGSIAITEITSSRAKGTFTGTGECFNSNFNVSSFSVTNGTFDVPLVTTLPQ